MNITQIRNGGCERGQLWNDSQFLPSANGWIVVSLPETTQKEKQIGKGRETDFSLLHLRCHLMRGDQSQGGRSEFIGKMFRLKKGLRTELRSTSTLCVLGVWGEWIWASLHKSETQEHAASLNEAKGRRNFSSILVAFCEKLNSFFCFKSSTSFTSLSIFIVLWTSRPLG